MRSGKQIVRALCTMSVFMGLAACGGKSAPLGDEPTLSGQIEGWNRGEGFMLQGTAANNVMVGSAPIDAAGNFSITLAGQSVLGGKLEPVMANAYMTEGVPTCMGVVTFDPSTIYQAGLTLRAVNGTTRLNIEHSIPIGIGPTAKVASYIFVESDASQTGSATCSDEMLRGTTTYNVHYKTGWNRLISQYTAVSETTIELETYTGDLPEGLAWRVH